MMSLHLCQLTQMLCRLSAFKSLFLPSNHFSCLPKVNRPEASGYKSNLLRCVFHGFRNSCRQMERLSVVLLPKYFCLNRLGDPRHCGGIPFRGVSKFISGPRSPGRWRRKNSSTIWVSVPELSRTRGLPSLGSSSPWRVSQVWGRMSVSVDLGKSSLPCAFCSFLSLFQATGEAWVSERRQPGDPNSSASTLVPGDYRPFLALKLTVKLLFQIIRSFQSNKQIQK